jgi:hypothetical protein
MTELHDADAQRPCDDASMTELHRLTRCDQAAVVKRLGDKVANGRVHPVLLAEHRNGPAQKLRHQQQHASHPGQGSIHRVMVANYFQDGAKWLER